MTGESDTGAPLTYGYDDSGRLSTTDTHSVAYDTQTDPSTLPTGAAATYDQAGELTSSTKGSTTTAYTYDSIGARTRVDPSTGPTVNYRVNALGQLVSAKSTAATGPLSGTGVAFAVNGQGLRVGETTTSGTQTFTWDPTSSVPRVLTDGTTAFIYGLDGGVAEQVDLSTTAPTYLVADQLDSIRLLTDQSGTVVGTYSYDAYGNLVSHTGSATTSIGFAGGWSTTADGLLYLVHRYYDPSTGSFLSVDPLVATTTQPYAYATNDAPNLTDPSGMYTFGICASDSTALGIGVFNLGTGSIGSFCLVRTLFSPGGNDDIGITETVGDATGSAVGISIGAGIGFQVSNANTLQELGTTFTSVDVSAGALSVPVGLSGSFFWGTAKDGRNIYGIDGSVTFGEGESVAKYSTFTWVQQASNSVLANSLRIAWDILAPPSLVTLSGISKLADDAITGSAQFRSHPSGTTTTSTESSTTSNC